MTTTQTDAIKKRLKLLELDHTPEGFPAVQMKDISALLAALQVRDQQGREPPSQQASNI